MVRLPAWESCHIITAVPNVHNYRHLRYIVDCNVYGKLLKRVTVCRRGYKLSRVYFLRLRCCQNNHERSGEQENKTRGGKQNKKEHEKGEKKATDGERERTRK